MKKILITGFSGFVGHHFVKFLFENNFIYEICGTDLHEPTYNYEQYNTKLNIKFWKVNLLNIEQLELLLTFFRPDYILHLASFSSVAYSWQYPKESFVNNTNIFLNLCTVVRNLNIQCRILSVGSSEEYGCVTEDEIPLVEEHILKPNSPYSIARVSQEMLSQLFVKSYKLEIVLTRSFNHIGPWQDERFVIPSFIKRIVDIEKMGKEEGTIETGDISIIRDFIDVRDVVKAYYLLLINGRSGEVYNVCSNRGVSLEDVIKLIAEKLNVRIRTKINYDYVRPQDNKIIIGSYNKIFKELEWAPKIGLENSIMDMIKIITK